MRIVVILVIAWLIALAFGEAERQAIENPTILSIDLDGLTRPTEIDGPLRNLVIGGNARKALRLDFHGTGRTLALELTLRVRGTTPEIVRFDQQIVMLDRCSTTTTRKRDCVFRVELGTSDQSVNIVSMERSSISNITTRLLKSNRPAATGNLPILTVFALLALIGPIFWRLSLPACQCVILILGASWILAADWRLGFAVFLMLGAFYVAVRQQIANPGSGGVFRIGLMGAIGALVFVKGVIPHAAALFASPGNLLMIPLGFSYFIIRIVDLLFKAHARQISELSLREYLAYMLFAPTLAAGPVMTLPQFQQGFENFTSLESRSVGLMRAFVGLAKKLLADTFMLRVLAPALANDYPGGGPAVLAVQLGFVLYVYLDFSGYSDIAIGTARWWGWRLPENFNAPLLRSNMREFWRNWHMSMTQWVSRHVFMQAGMELRRGPIWMQTYLPVLTTMTVIGLWHGLNAVWVLWALHHALGIFLGDWGRRLIPISVLDGEPTKPPSARNVLPPLRYAFGVVFVWYWVALSHSFTLSNNPGEALKNYVAAASLGLL